MLRTTRARRAWIVAALLGIAVPAAGAQEFAPSSEARVARESPERSSPARPALWQRWADELQARATRALERVPRRWRPHVDEVAKFVSDPVGHRVGLGILGGLAVLIVLLRLARRPGDLIVFLDYPAELRGTFSVRIATRKGALRRSAPGQRAPQEAASTRTEHHRVARETQFQGVRPGRYWVAVEGMLQDPGTQVLVDEPFEVRSTTVLPRRSGRVEIGFHPHGCAVTVKVLWTREPVHEGTVAAFGQPDSLRYTRQGVVRLDLPLGSHRIVAGSADRVGERELTLDTFRSTSLEIDLGVPETLVFKGCPPAVEPYLRGDLGTAARALSRDGQASLANRLQALVHEEGGQLDRAATLYEKAGDAENALRLSREVRPEQSGYVTACERLADSLESRGELEAAAAKVEEAATRAGPERRPGLYLRSSDLLERADDPRGALAMLEKLSQLEPDNPEVAPRVEELQKQISGETRITPVTRGGEQQGGRYQLLERIGTGGMGVVYRALDSRLGREVALKQLPESLRDNPLVVSLFLREARSAASLNHANIVTLFDAGEEDGSYFITMELLAGVTLGQLRKRRGRVDPIQVARLGAQIADGLQFAHYRRIVHRDVKPSNLFLTHEGDVKIMDFGLAKTMEEVRRSSTVIGGTPYYMAPEQSAGGVVDPSADLYSLGVTFFELMTGRLPFEGGDVTYEHRHSAPPDPRDFVPAIPDALAELVLHLLEKDPAGRPANAAEVSERLRRFASV